jgi:hypothetical protein
VLPADDHDERVGEHIEAFLDGPEVRARKRRRTRAHRPELRSIRRPVAMDTRTDWDAALRHEDARVARYGRPAAVLVVRIRLPVPGGGDRYAGRVGLLLRELARETDRVARASQDRFHVLLPETTAAQAEALADRIRSACARLVPGLPGGEIEVLASASAAARGRTLHDALRTALADTAD